ncbi:ZBED1 protein, partial [Amia calva]|nr:ZBED1 protein [Amia calva]
KKKLKSAVWEYFGYPKNERGVVLEDGYPVCKKCGRRVAANGGNTSNIFSHIREHHPSVQIKVRSVYKLRPYYFSTSAKTLPDPAQPTVTQSLAKGIKFLHPNKPNDREHPQAEREENLAGEGSSSTTTTTKKKEKSLSGLLQRITSGNENVSDKVLSEMKSLPTISTDTDPLAWWKMHADKMPLLAHEARKYLCVPAMSVPSEWMFSTSGHILSPQQSRMSPENLNMLTFRHHNLA